MTRYNTQKQVYVLSEHPDFAALSRWANKSFDVQRKFIHDLKPVIYSSSFVDIVLIVAGLIIVQEYITFC